MARTDAVVLGAGIVGTSIALHLAKRGLSVALVDRGGPGEETSYGNAGVIEGNTVFPPAFPPGLVAAAGRAQARAGGELPSRLPAAGGALAVRLLARVAAEEAVELPPPCGRCLRARWPSTRRCMTEAGALHICARRLDEDLSQRADFRAPWRRSSSSPTSSAFPIACSTRRGCSSSSRRWRRHFGARMLWPDAASLTNPLAVTQAYAARFEALGGVILVGDARTLHRTAPLAGRYRARPARRRSRSWWRSGPGRRTCWSRSASTCRSASSAAITGISAQPATWG